METTLVYWVSIRVIQIIAPVNSDLDVLQAASAMVKK